MCADRSPRETGVARVPRGSLSERVNDPDEDQKTRNDERDDIVAAARVETDVEEEERRKGGRAECGVLFY